MGRTFAPGPATATNPIKIMDVSEKFRPETLENPLKSEEDFRNYSTNNEFFSRVEKTYTTMHTEQSLAKVHEKLQYWTKFDKAQLSILEVLEKLDDLIDESDPDINIANSVHAYQTAERIRRAHPEQKWFHLVGLIHDLGKVMALWGEEQHFVVGDTFPVGCPFSDKIVFGTESFKKNQDYSNELYNHSENGIYQPNCGLNEVTMSWGHDEYLYRLLVHNKCQLPEEAMYIIRYHSFYPWHTSGEYMSLCNEKDIEMLKWVKEFNKFDLYSKSDEIPDVKAIKPYYESLIKLYLPDILDW